MSRWVVEAGAVLVIGIAVTGWHYRANIQALVNPPASAAHPMAQPDVLYTWVDKDGVTHYSQKADPVRKAERVEYDGSAITPIAPAAAPIDVSLGATEAMTEDGRQGGKFIHSMRDDIQRNREKMDRAKMVAVGLEE